MGKVDSVLIFTTRELDECAIKLRQGNGMPLNLIIHLKMNSLVLGKILKTVRDLNNKQYKVSVVIETQDLDFSGVEIENFKILDESLKSLGVNLSFSAKVKNDYTLNEIMDPQVKLNEFIKTISDDRLSPYEKFLMIYDYVASSEYMDHKFHTTNTRDMLENINTNSLANFGKAYLIQYLCEMVGIKCLVQRAELSKIEGDPLNNYQNNLVFIEDKNYNIRGWYYADVCCDSTVKTEGYKKSFNYCLIPISDKDKLKHRRIKVYPPHDIVYKTDVVSRLKFLDEDLNDRYQEFFDDSIITLEKNARKRVSNLQLKSLACDYLIKLLKYNNIPADFYQRYSNIPSFCSLKNLLALILMGEVNNEMFIYMLNGILDTVKNQQPVSDDSKLKNENFDIYKTLEVMKISKSGMWNEVEKVYLKLLVLGMVQGEDFQEGSPIKLESLKEALENIYVLQGATESAIESHIRKVVSYNEKMATRIFKEDATNCFSQSAIQKQLEQQMKKH